MASRREIKDLETICGLLIACLHQQKDFTDDEYDTISKVVRRLERDMIIYRLEHYRPSINAPN
jgi:hypothetical protein